MQKIKAISSSGFYVFRGRATANSCFIENISHARIFKIYMNYYLKGYLKVYDFCLTKDGWEIVVKLKNESEILAQPIPKKLKDIIDVEEKCWKIVSERIRLFLSTFVRVSNKARGRTGTLVHNSYERFYFEKLSSAIEHINDMRQNRITYYRKGAKYEGIIEHYNIDQEDEVKLSSRAGNKRKCVDEFMSEVLYYKVVTKLVLQKALNLTKSLHQKQKSTKPLRFPLRN